MGHCHLELGRFGEEYAARWLVVQGAQVLARNWRCAAGEIDIIAAFAELELACEVKTRRGIGRGHPSEAVDARRRQRLAAAAELWLAGRPGRTMRVDAISITVDAQEIQLQHVPVVVG